ncbi:MAG TPA: flagellar protein FlaG [Nitrospira sp.]|mgnify:CR=1 FL=1|nr:flagellar protein FlaG [Nitrospira sp.]
MITNVTSKVDLPAAANNKSQAAVPPRTKPVVEPAQGADFSFASPTDRVALEQAVSKVKEAFQQSGSQLQIEVDPDLERVIVKILNGDSGEVIRQIPPKEVIDLAKNLPGAKGLLFEEHG